MLLFKDQNPTCGIFKNSSSERDCIFYNIDISCSV